MTPKRPVVSCVVLDDSTSPPTCSEGFDLKTASEHVLAQANDLAQQLSSKIGALSLARAVIRVADFAPTASRSTGPRNRLLIEGALGFACMQHVPQVDVRDGREIGRILVGTKKDAKKDAEIAGAALDAARKVAASAALSTAHSTS